MFGVTDYAAFVVAFIILLAIPGPGNLALILSTGKGGIRGGLASTFGIIFGDQVLLWLAVAGVAALLKAYPAAFHVVQWLGAAYLIYLGLRMILAKPGAAPMLNIKPRQYLWQTLVITVFNPKAIVFYMALLSAVHRSAAPSGADYFRFHGRDHHGADLLLRPADRAADALSRRAHARQPTYREGSGEAGRTVPGRFRGQTDAELIDGRLRAFRSYVLIRAIIFRIET